MSSPWCSSNGSDTYSSDDEAPSSSNPAPRDAVRRPPPTPSTPSTPTRSLPSSTRTSTRRRRADVTSTRRIRAPTPHHIRHPSSSRRRPYPPSSAGAAHAATAVGSFLLDLLRVVAWLVRKPLLWVLAVWLLVGVVMVAYSSLVGAAVGTLCALPGVPFFMTEICDQGQEGMAGAKGGRAGEQPDFQTLMRLQAGFEEMVEECHDFTVFAWDLRHSETAVRDLTSLVKPSRLACKDALLVNLEEYITVVSGAARQLSAYTGLVTGMTDRVIAADTFAIRHFEELATLKTAARASSSNAWPWTSFLESKRSELEIASAERRLLRIYQTTVNTTENAIRQLIVHGTIIMETLGSLENGLNKVEDTVQQERAVIGEAQEEVLAHVWTYLGGNKRQLQRMQSHQFLLENISGYRKRALTYLLKTLLHLQAMEGDLKHIAEVVGEPMLDGPDGSIPIAVQIATIRRGADRLAEGVKKTHNKRESYNQKILSAWDTFVKTS